MARIDAPAIAFSTAPPRIAVLMTCHNRKALTLACLGTLRTQALFAEENLFLVDDGSTDGTGDAVRQAMPGANVVQGDGSLFWNGGMRLAWDSAKASDVAFDFYLWLNDDVRLLPDTLDMLVADADGTAPRGEPVIVAAATLEPGTDRITYGAHRRPDPSRPLRISLVAPQGHPVRVDTISGNIVLVSAAAERLLGNMHPGFEHIYGDLDYGFRAVAKQVPVVLASRPGGTCSANSPRGSSLDEGLSRIARLRRLWAENRKVHARDWRRFVALHGGGNLAALAHRAAPYLRILLNRPNHHATTVLLEEPHA